ncbi:MAG: PilZ domain-containing protein [Desulfuromusa sp.]|nr:PilZ domain-containing protein [Desulfuromusa sp.]
MAEYRNDRRANFCTEADIGIEGKDYRCDLVDLALQGVLFRSEHRLPLSLGSHNPLSICLPDSAVRMEFTGELIHQRGNFYGFIFTSEEPESMEHLHRLLKLNFDDAKQSEEEFSHWLRHSSAD